jgi:putative peptidoglycan lipid II flippase
MLNRIMFPYLAFVSLSALVMGVLNSLHRFAAPAFAPVMLNLSVIGFSFFSGAFREPAVALAVGVVVGGILQIVIQIPSLRATGWRLRWVWNLRHPGVLRVSKLMGPLIFGIGIVQINVLIDLQFATYMGEGAFASINYADRIMELVLGGYAIALSTAVLPLLSRQAAEERLGEMRTTLNFSIRLILFVTLPATAGLILLGTPIVEILFERGEFTAESTALTVNALIYFALGLSLFSLMKIIVPAYYALHDTRTPVMIAFLAMLLNLALNFVFFFVFFDRLRNGGPPLATSISALFSCIVLFVIFRNRHGALGLRSIAVSIGKFLIATVVMGVVAYAVIHIPEFYAGSFWQRATALVVSIAAATGTYFATAYLLRARELTEMGGIFSRRAARTP